MNIREVWSEKVLQFYEDDNVTGLLDLITKELLEEVKDALQIKSETLYGITLYFLEKTLVKIALKLIEEYTKCAKNEYSCFQNFINVQLQKYPHIRTFVEQKCDFQKIEESANS